jgi:signal transduction histidine kinase
MSPTATPELPKGQPVGDTNRLRALRGSGLLDSPPAPSFDRSTELVRLALQCDVSLISLVDSTRQFFKSQCGLPEPYATLRETPLSHSFCQHVVTSGTALRITNAPESPLVCNNLAIRDLGVIAYLGTPLVSTDGFVLGSLCAISSRPRQWSATELHILENIAQSVLSEIRLNLAYHDLAEELEARKAAENERDEIIQSLIHDMRTPLAAAITSLELAENHPLTAEENRELLEIIRSSNSRLMGMLNDILQQSRLEAQTEPKLTTINAGNLLYRAAKTIQPLAASAGLDFRVDYPPEEIAVRADESLLLRVLLNLASNAAKFCPSGSILRIGATRVPGGCRFTVTDNGPGISTEKKPVVLVEPDVAGSDAPAGLTSFGLGLKFCKRTLRAHGSELVLEDTEGGGCAFSFTIAAPPDESA